MQGGTTVPLEVNTVRFVDNFSAGTRGSASAEYFLAAGYAVVFLHREKSLCPYTRHIDSYQLLQSMSVQTSGDILISGEQFLFYNTMLKSAISLEMWTSINQQQNKNMIQFHPITYLRLRARVECCSTRKKATKSIETKISNIIHFRCRCIESQIHNRKKSKI